MLTTTQMLAGSVVERAERSNGGTAGDLAVTGAGDADTAGRSVSGGSVSGLDASVGAEHAVASSTMAAVAGPTGARFVLTHR